MSPTAQTPTPFTTGFAHSSPLLLLRLEAAALLTTTLLSFHHLKPFSWLTFAGLLLLPDVGMAGYVANTRVGAALYNCLHTTTPAMLMLGAALVRGQGGVMGGNGGKGVAGVALVWLAHIGMDRMLGYGLKYGTGFGCTHLGEIGRGKREAK
jgi:hypothetical protein